MDTVTIASITPIVRENVAREARLMTDEAGMYRYTGTHFSFHGTTRHTFGEYVRGHIHSNTWGRFGGHIFHAMYTA